MAKLPKFRKVWIDTDKTDGKPGPWRRGWQRIVRPISWRTKIKQSMDWALRNEPRISYDQSRPFDPTTIKRRQVPMSDDCSATTTQLYYSAGRPDPNGKKYNGTGYTGTLRSHTPQRKALRNMRVGDFIVHGTGTGAHVTVVYKPGKTPGTMLVWSHGQEAGPLLTTLATQIAVHGGTYTLHDGGRLK